MIIHHHAASFTVDHLTFEEYRRSPIPSEHEPVLAYVLLKSDSNLAGDYVKGVNRL